MRELQTVAEMQKEPIENLFLLMAMKDEDATSAELAFNEFYRRYKDYLYTVCKKACSSWSVYGSDLHEAVFQHTILKVYERAETFIEVETLPDDKAKERRTKAWLGKIASNELEQILRKSDKNIDFTDNLPEVSLTDSENKDDSIETIEHILLNRALASLKERERDILITYMRYDDGNKKLPPEEIDRLCEHWQVLQDNLRQIKSRAMKKVKEYINKYQNK